jgi:hypothetical protein
LVERINSRNLTEIVLFQGERARRSHQVLFSLREDCYVAARQGITESILLSADKGVVKLHVVTGWVDILKVALWKSRNPSPSEVHNFLGRVCSLPRKLNFPAAEADAVFRKLYDGGRLDVLRKVCKAAKRVAEARVGRGKLLVHCHLVDDAGGRIVASSL